MPYVFSASIIINNDVNCHEMKSRRKVWSSVRSASARAAYAIAEARKIFQSLCCCRSARYAHGITGLSEQGLRMPLLLSLVTGTMFYICGWADMLNEVGNGISSLSSPVAGLRQPLPTINHSRVKRPALVLLLVDTCCCLLSIGQRYVVVNLRETSANRRVYASTFTAEVNCMAKYPAGASMSATIIASWFGAVLVFELAVLVRCICSTGNYHFMLLLCVCLLFLLPAIWFQPACN